MNPTASVPSADSRRVFISYKRNSEPDETLARALVETLSRENFPVFIDRMIGPSEIWAKRIEAEVRNCHWLIVLLSEASCRSEMLKGELELARDEASKSGGRPRILPIRAGFSGPLPYPLNAYLDHIQYASWDQAASLDGLVREVLDAIEGRAPALPRLHSNRLSAPGERPSHSAELRPPGGTSEKTDPFYIVRQSERKAMRLLPLGGQTIIIKGPRQTGKSSLLNRLASAARERGKKVALLDFQLFDQATRESAEHFFREFGQAITEAFDLPHSLDAAYPAKISIRNLTSFVEQKILKDLDGPILIAIDEADRVFGAPFQFDFFAMLRVWHNLRADTKTEAYWKRVDLALVSATEPYMFIDSPNQSPFNVGEVLRLEDFSLDQVSQLHQLHAAYLPPVHAADLFRLLGGHPYLTRRALYEMAQDPEGSTPELLLECALEDRGPFRDHLRHYWLSLERHPQLADALGDIVHGRPFSDKDIFYRLEGAGLVKLEKGRIAPRCLLYGEYFRTHLRAR